MAVNDLITFRKGPASQWISVNPVLASGEPGYDLTNSILKIGDGVSNWVALSGIGSTSVGGSSSSSVGVRGVISTTGTLSSFPVSGGYSLGYLDLFQNGVKLLSGSDFTATNGTSVTLSNSVPSGTVLEYISLGTSVSSSNYTKLDSIGSSFNGSSTSFGLAVSGTPYYPVSANTLGIYVGGVAQEPISSYSVSGSNIIFTEAPASGLTFWGVGYGTTAVATLNGIVPGSVSSPAISSSNDLNTGFYFPTSGSLAIASSGYERFKIYSNGNACFCGQNVDTLRYVDIDNGNNSSNAGSILRLVTTNISATGNISADLIKRKNGQFSINNNETDISAFTSFNVGNSERLRITSSGNVGIGTTTPTTKLHVVGGISATSGDFTNNLQVNNVNVSVSGHTHSSSDITNFNSSVSGLLPITNIIAGNGINVAISGTTATITSDDTRWNVFLPSAPTGLSVTTGNGQASLSWTAPTGVIAQAPITDYCEQYSVDNGANWTTFTAATSTATTATVTGLTNGTAYVFRVAAVNAVGVGAFTAASASVTPGIASAPTGLTANAGNAQIALAWTAPSNIGASALTNYRVEYTPSGGSAQTVLTGSTATSYTLTGLTNGTAYTVRVAAVNSAGTGTYTAASSSVTPISNTDALFSSVSLLSTFNGSNNATVFTDLSNNAASYSSNGVVTDTSVVKYGTASAYFSTTSSQLSLASTSVMPYGTENFCIECWLYPTTNADDNTLIGSTASNGLVLAWWNGGGTLRVGNIGPFPYSLDIQRDILSLNTWWHLAVTRSGGDLRVFKNGVQQGATASIGSYSFGRGQTRIGLVGGVGRYDNPDVARSFIGYIDDLRITRGQARYVSNFTPPSSQLAP